MKEEDTEEDEKERKDEALKEEKTWRRGGLKRLSTVDGVVSFFHIFLAHVVCIFPSRDTALWLLPNNV